MHRRIDAIYQHCDHGCSHHLSANLEEGTFAGVRQAFEKAIAFLHGKKTFRPEHLKSKAVAGYISETFNVLKADVKEGIAHEIPAKMMNRLNSSVFLFSGMKVFTALKESQLTLTDEKGQVKTWDRFKADAKAIDSKYNENYLRAERRYAVDAAHATGEWNRFWKDKDFDLEYLTDNGPNVRDSHRALEHTVLPMDASFWSSYFPPNGWNCHCKVVRVPKGDKPHSDNDEAVRKGEASTTVLDKNGKNSAAIFRYNPGKQQIIFPEKHPYYPQHCNGEKLNLSGWMGLGKWLLDAEGERCKAKKIVEELQKSVKQKKRESYISEMEPLLKKSVIRYVGNDRHIKIGFTKKGNEHIANDVLNKIPGLDKKELSLLHIELKEAQYVRSSDLYKERKDDIIRFYYFKNKEKKLFYNVAEKQHKTKSGKVKIDRFLYSITKEIPKSKKGAAL